MLTTFLGVGITERLLNKGTLYSDGKNYVVKLISVLAV